MSEARINMNAFARTNVVYVLVVEYKASVKVVCY